MSSRIEQIIEEIEEYIDSCKFQPLSTTKIIVNKDQIDELLRELRMKTPDEIKRYQKIIANKDAILADAQAKADSMLQEAQIQTSELVSEHEIMQQAYAQANEIVTAATEQAQQILDNATNDANDIRIGAMQYTDDLLANAESIIGHTLDSYTTKYDGLVNSLQECYDMVRNNRSELEIPDQSARGLEAEYGPPAEPVEADEEDSIELESEILPRLLLSEHTQIEDAHTAGHHCGDQLFYEIDGYFQASALDHTVGLCRRAESAKRCKSHDQHPPYREGRLQPGEHRNAGCDLQK